LIIFITWHLTYLIQRYFLDNYSGCLKKSDVLSLFDTHEINNVGSNRLIATIYRYHQSVA
jgi:hypothetical protein